MCNWYPRSIQSGQLECSRDMSTIRSYEGDLKSTVPSENLKSTFETLLFDHLNIMLMLVVVKICLFSRLESKSQNNC